MEELHASLRRTRVSRLDLVDADERGDFPLVPVDGLEDLGDDDLVRLALEQPLEARARRPLHRVAVQHLAVHLDGGLRRVHPRLAELRQLQHQLDAPLLIVRELELPVHVVGELRPHALPCEEIIEGGQGPRRRRIELEDLPVHADGGLGLTELLVVEGGHLAQELLLELPVERLLHATAEHPGEIRPALRAPKKTIEGHEHLVVSGAAGEHLPVARDRSVHVLELHVLDRGALHPERARELRVRRLRRELPEELHERRETLVGDGQRLQAREGLRGVGLLTERVAVGRESIIDAAEALGVGLADLREELDALLGTSVPAWRTRRQRTSGSQASPSS